jgi:hypothetical protein
MQVLFHGHSLVEAILPCLNGVSSMFKVAHTLTAKITHHTNASGCYHLSPLLVLIANDLVQGAFFV